MKLAECYWKLKDLGKAIEFVNAAIACNSFPLELYSSMALCQLYIENKNPEKIREICLKAAKQCEDKQTIFDQTDDIYYLTEIFEEEVNSLEYFCNKLIELNLIKEAYDVFDAIDRINEKIKALNLQKQDMPAQQKKDFFRLILKIYLA